MKVITQKAGLSEWSGLSLDASLSQNEEFSKEKPIPYVSLLSPSGLMTIKWDREMQKI